MSSAKDTDLSANLGDNITLVTTDEHATTERSTWNRSSFWLRLNMLVPNILVALEIVSDANIGITGHNLV